MRKIVTLIKHGGILLLRPLFFFWRFTLRPVTIVIYKIYILLSQRSKLFFHAQHKLLAVITNRYAIHGFVLMLSIGIMFTNIAQAESVRSEEFAQHSLFNTIFATNDETIVTAETIASSTMTYLNTAAAVKITPVIEDDETTNDSIIVAGNGSALVQSSALDSSGTNSNSIQQYTVQTGDTASSIAAKFGVSTKTVLSTNGLSDSSLIKPGQKLYILPVTGVAYTVQSGDTVDKIAEKFQGKSDEIIAYNNFVSASDLKAGEEIIIPNGQAPAPPPPAPNTRLSSIRDVFQGGGSAPSGTPAPNAPVAGSGMQWPTVTHRLSRGYLGAYHNGLDIDGNFGDPIYATNGGRVIQAGWAGGYGWMVLIDHGNGIQTRYGHLQKIFVSSGQTVGKGQTIGEMGSSGNSTGSHLHFEVIVGGSTTNPYNYVR